MVVKLNPHSDSSRTMFESRVILDGSQTREGGAGFAQKFESRVILDGSQTDSICNSNTITFESRVILDGSQTFFFWRAAD